jgi:hypothetical protein
MAQYVLLFEAEVIADREANVASWFSGQFDGF